MTNPSITGLETEPRDVAVAAAGDRTDSNGVLLLAGMFAVALVVLLIGAVTGVQALRVIGALGSLLLGLGAAPFQLNRDLALGTRFGLAVLVGISWLLIVGAIMADIPGLWAPAVAAGLSVLISLPLHAAGVARALPGRDVVSLRRRLRHLRRDLPADLSASIVLTLVGTVLWLVPALTTHDPAPGDGGLLAVISPVWFVGVAFVVTGLVVGRRQGGWGAVPVTILALATTLTPSLVYGSPKDVTAFKQILLTQYVLAHHHINPTSGIYPAYSSLFSGTAWVAQSTGIRDLFGIATFWPALMAPLRVIALALLARRATDEPGRRWIMVLLVVLTDAFGQDYYSPQSVGYILAFLVVALLMQGPDLRLNRRWLPWLALLAGIAGAPTHELSPFIAVGALIILVLLGRAPRWAPLPVLLPALAWAGVVHNAVGHLLSFGQLFDLSNFRPPSTSASAGLARSSVIGLQSHMWLASLVVLSLAALVGFLSNIRSRSAWAYILCPAVGLAAVAANPYGNEGIFRASIFGIPWLALSAALVAGLPDGSRLRRIAGRERRRISAALVTGGLVIVGLAFLGSFLIGDYELDGLRSLQRPDWTVAQRFARLATPDSLIMVMGTGENPIEAPPFTVRYQSTDWVNWVNLGYPIPLHPTERSLERLERQLRSFESARSGGGPRPIYVWWARTQVAYDAAYGVYSRPSFDRWLTLLKRSRAWSIADRANGSYVFRLRPR